MLEPFRSEFNARFTEEQYAHLLAQLHTKMGEPLEFRASETPCFLPKSLVEEMVQIGDDLTHQLVDSESYRAASDVTVPEQYCVPNESKMPHFMTVDFGLVRDAEGQLRPKLVELQAFPSVLGFQSILAQQYVESYNLPASLQWFLGGLDEEGFWQLLSQVILNGHDPEQVVLMEVEPHLQKTRPDFRVYERRLGIVTVDIAHLRKEGRQLMYQRDGRWVPIRRIYNRAIVDEIERKQIQLPFDYRDDLDVEWAGHPNWFYRISKFSLPFLRHPAVPETVFLDDWFAGKGSAGLPEDHEDLLLKPLYSFAGRGIQFGPTKAELEAIPHKQRSFYLLQERMDFEPVIHTPYKNTQIEVRIMYLCPDGKKFVPSISLIRMGRGRMMGVDHNKNQKWVGASAGFLV